MNRVSAFHMRRMVFAVFIVALLCRGQWIGEQNLHAASIDSVSITLHQDHSHTPVGHHHSTEASVSDMTHALLHVLSVMDSHMPVNFAGAVQGSFKSSPEFYITSSPLASQSQPLFRPPRFA